MSLKNKKTRTPFTSHVLIESVSPDEEGVIEGYASVFKVNDGKAAYIEEGAYTKTVKEQTRIPILFNHDADKPIGLAQELRQDKKGLYIKAKLNLATQLGRDVYENIKAGVINAFSIGAEIIKEEYDETILRGGRKITEAALFETSVVTFPANKMALIDMVQSEFNSTSEEFANIIEEKINNAINRIVEMNKSDDDLFFDTLSALHEQMQSEEESIANAIFEDSTEENNEGGTEFEFFTAIEAASDESMTEPQDLLALLGELDIQGENKQCQSIKQKI